MRIWAVLTFVVACLLTILCGTWPNFYRFVQDGPTSFRRALTTAPMRLSDDVMISLRSGYILAERGVPAFNRTDLAQPSTSYLSPYLFEALLKVARPDLAVALYGLLGLLSVGLTGAVIVLYSRSALNAILLTIALLVTTTNLLYALNGWDHLFQGLFFTLATGLTFRDDQVSERRALAVSVLLALGTLSRPDGVILSVGLLASLYLSSVKRLRFIALGIAPYLVVVGAALVRNFQQFAHLTPTTSRLKWGAAPSLGYIARYTVENGAVTYSALTLLVVLTLFYLTFRHTMPRARHVSVVLGCWITAAIALYNSDYFKGARMLWTPACVMAMMIAASVPAVLSSGKIACVSQAYRRQSLSPGARRWFITSRAIVVLIALIVALGGVVLMMKSRFKEALIGQDEFYRSSLAQQYVIAKWIGDNLSPHDGAIGFFFLGVSFDLPRFEIADFMGKADESIASLPVRTGPPGHNKWDIDRTLDKWKPQAIVPAGPIDPMLPQTRENSHRHAPDLLLNSHITSEFTYCYVPNAGPNPPDKWGFFLRKNIASRHLNQLKCSTTP